MKKLLVFAGVSLIFASCNVNYGGYPINPYPANNSGSAANTAREYEELIKNL
jgi:hypothetical protein